MKSISDQFLPKLAEGKTSVGLEQKIKIRVGLGSVPKNTFCLGGRYVVQPKNKREREKRERETNDLWHFFMYSILELM